MRATSKPISLRTRIGTLAPLLASLVALPVQAQAPAGWPARGSERVYDVRAFGAHGDSISIDTDAINRAIAAAVADGGGTVYFPPGTYSSFSIHLGSNVTLFLEQGATLFAATPGDRDGYDAAEPAPNGYQDYGHSHWHNSLMWGEHIDHVAIVGPGRIDGYGLSRNITRDTPRAGNKVIALKNVRHVLLRDFSVYRAGHFAILATGVDDLTIDNLSIDTNRDGIDIDACRMVRLANTVVNSPYDDAIVLKTSYALGEPRATEDVTVSNSVVSGYAMGSVLAATYLPFTSDSTSRGGPTGRVKLGTESDAPFRNITISNVVFDHSRGLALESVDGAELEDIAISNLTMRHVSSSPLFLRLGARMRGPSGVPVGALRRVTISNVTVFDADPRFPSILSGIPGHPIDDVQLNNVRIVYRGGFTMDEVLHPTGAVARGDVRADTAAGQRTDPYAVPERETAYPEPSMFGVLPAYGFYVRHARGIRMTNVQVSFEQPDGRPAFVFDDAGDIALHQVEAQKPSGAPRFVLRDVDFFRLVDSPPSASVSIRHAHRQSF
jgi:polygalacturonase